MIVASIPDYREAARRRLPRFLFDYIDGGSYGETTLARNLSDLAGVPLDQRVLVDVSAIDTDAVLMGQTAAMPVILGPIGLAGMTARRGEVQAAAAARDAGLPFCLSTVSVCPISEVSGGAGTPPWFQLYMLRDRGFVEAMIGRARDAQCPVLVFTVDLPVPGARYRDKRSGLAGAPGLSGTLRRGAQAAIRPQWCLDVIADGGPLTLGNVAGVMGATTPLSDFLGWLAANFDPSATWADLAWVRRLWPGQLLVKGILHADDARAALAEGADGIVVSNHGGRQLDGAMSAVRALPAIRDAVGNSLSVLADGGIRSGLDVLRYVTLGADGVLLGRAWAWALAAGGEAGVAAMLALVRAELTAAMALTGRTRLFAPVAPPPAHP
jgi:L-lactate dehydrogenase (cytochrome)